MNSHQRRYVKRKRIRKLGEYLILVKTLVRMEGKYAIVDDDNLLRYFSLNKTYDIDGIPEPPVYWAYPWERC